VALISSRLPKRRQVAQLHWGGGTPTFLTASQLGRLKRILSTAFELSGDAEVSVEVNPATTTTEHLVALRELGFNRLSLGVQDLDPRVQRAINRDQTLEQTQATLLSARTLGFASINFDLVYGLPFQTMDSWRTTLAALVDLRPDRMALFGFAFLPSVMPHQRKLPVSQMAVGSARLALFQEAVQSFTRAGYEPVGMDHFALPHDALAVAQRMGTLTRNFQGYSARAVHDVIGLGVSAISDVGGAYAQNVKSLDQYESAIDAGRLPVSRGLKLSEDDQLRQTLIGSVMCQRSADVSCLGPVERARLRQRLEGLLTDGLVYLDANHLAVSEQGRFFLRNVAMAFDAYLDSGKQAFSRTV
jgi:oxygen-independent coproporphyrinogen III oxidase